MASKIKKSTFKDLKMEIVSGTGNKQTDVVFAKNWTAFKEAFVTCMNNAESATVSLGFESSYDNVTHHSFNAEESVFVSDMKITPEGKIVFVANYGAKDKTFTYDDAEIIEVVEEGKTSNLREVITRVYNETMGTVTEIEARNLNFFEKKYLNKNTAMVEMLNSAEDYVASLSVNAERKESYGKIKNFGIF